MAASRLIREWRGPTCQRSRGKFRLESLPPAEKLQASVSVVQGYVYLDPGELRVRRKGSRCFLTVKGDGTLSRDEWEQEIPDWVFLQLWPRTEGRRIEKTRYTTTEDGHTYEIDVFSGSLEGLILAECEFPTEDRARHFDPPAWFGPHRDVTADPAFKNKSLAARGLPTPESDR